MRLIDADAIKCDGDCQHCQFFKGYDIDGGCEILEMPTAYDVDKVVEDLEYASYCKSTPTFDHPYTDSIIDLNEAINIVKRGGIDEVG